METAPSHPPQCAHWGSLPLLAPFGRHFPLTGGISLPPGEGILTPNPPAQNRRPVIKVICNSTHVTIPDINITWESNPTHGPARCQYYVPICSGTGSVTPAFCAAKKSIFNFQTQSRAAPRISPAAPSEIKWTARPGGRAIQSISQRVGGHMGPSLRLKRTTLITGSAPLIRLAFGPPLSPFGLQLFPPDRGNRTSPKGKALRAGLGPAPTADTKRLRFPCRGRSQTGPPGFAPGALARQSQVQKLNRTSGNFCTPRAQWPGGNSDPSLRFCAPKTLLNFSGGRPP